MVPNATDGEETMAINYWLEKRFEEENIQKLERKTKLAKLRRSSGYIRGSSTLPAANRVDNNTRRLDPIAYP
ncbi:hypothetical protein PIB30_002887 [Stylosanthes scabra]|uniref:Uncharacterized protein n=1 Tax=Stylosanthes scabra TaxID=79078 RepID=A0ABU6U2Z7_9FABA|nr:hypothetical protein [Stylosanthes scabra]